MARTNKEFEWGYEKGYDYAEYEGGTLSQVVFELRYRGLTIRSQYGVGFKKGVEDYRNHIPRRYGKL